MLLRWPPLFGRCGGVQRRYHFINIVNENQVENAEDNCSSLCQPNPHTFPRFSVHGHLLIWRRWALLPLEVWPGKVDFRSSSSLCSTRPYDQAAHCKMIFLFAAQKISIIITNHKSALNLPEQRRCESPWISLYLQLTGQTLEQQSKVEVHCSSSS